MRYQIVSETPARLRIRLCGRVPLQDVGALCAALAANNSVLRVRVYPQAGSVTLHLRRPWDRAAVLSSLASIDRALIDSHKAGADVLFFQPPSSLGFNILWRLCGYAARSLLPMPLAALWAIGSFVPFAKEALASLGRGELDVPVLDAAAICASLVQQDFGTAGSQIFLIKLAELLESSTRESSRLELINSLLDIPEKVWLRQGEEEMLVDVETLAAGDLIVIRSGSPIPVDGVVERGRAFVNQMTLTGEPQAIERTNEDDVYAGTTIEEGELYVRVRATAQKTRLRSIVALVEQTEQHKPRNQAKLEQLARRLVPWNFLCAGVLYLLTGSLRQAASVLMVDYSCALKLTGAITALAALREAAHIGFKVKGAHALETFAEADTLVFDKTGTLTLAEPHVAEMWAHDGWETDEVLRLAACLEEHFPHSVARAIVNAAAEKNLRHRERHTTVEYVVAHGIASELEGKRVVIGSAHFVFEDERIAHDEGELAAVNTRMGDLSPLFLAVDGVLVGVLGIHDPLKHGVTEQLAELRAQGFKRIIMLTGDNSRAAARVAAEAGIDEFYADLLPEQKHAFIETLRSEGHVVAMVGDGVNDTPALAAAHVGIAMGDGAAIASEVADITLADGNLAALVVLRRLSGGMLRRMRTSSALSLAFNTALLALGSTGALTASSSSLAHNGSTVMLALSDMRPLLAQGSGELSIP
jgi:heavy metal translocating P-type ATPase